MHGRRTLQEILGQPPWIYDPSVLAALVALPKPKPKPNPNFNPDPSLQPLSSQGVNTSSQRLLDLLLVFLLVPTEGLF